MNAPISCAQCQELLPEYLAGALTPAVAIAIHAHLTGCATCQAETRQWRLLVSATQAADENIPPDRTRDQEWQHLLERIAGDAAQRSPDSQAGWNTPWDSTAYPKGTPMLIDQRSIPPTPPELPPPRGFRAFATLPVVALSILVVTLIAFLVFRQTGPIVSLPGQSPGGVPTQAASADGCANGYSLAMPGESSIESVSMLSPQDGWAVGYTVPNTGLAQTLILHFSQCRWVTSGTPLPAAQLVNVQMLSATDGWALGQNLAAYAPAGQPYTVGIPSQTFLLHYDGTSWQPVALPLAHAITSSKLVMTGPDSGWLLGFNIPGGPQSGPAQTGPTTYDYILLHDQSGVWSSQSLPPGSDQTVFNALAPASDGTLWLTSLPPFSAGSTKTISTFWHVVNGIWSAQPAPIYDQITALAFSSTQDGWAIGTQVTNGVIATSNPIFLHFNGSQWQEVPIHGASDPKFSEFTALTLTASSGWAFGINQMSGGKGSNLIDVYQLVNGAWQLAHQQRLAGVLDAESADLTTASEGWAIGRVKGLARPNLAATPGVLVHFNLNGAWAAVGG